MKKLFLKIREDKNFVFTLTAILCVVGWFLLVIHGNFSRSLQISLGLIFSIFYFLINSVWLAKILARLGFEKEFQFIFGLFLLLFLIAFGMAVPIVFYKITPIYLAFLLISLTIIISLSSRLKRKGEKEETEKELVLVENNEKIKIPKFCYLLFAICYLLLWFLLFRARTGADIRSPWLVIHPFYLYGWLFIIFVIGLLIFSKCRLKTFLFFIILTSLLLHSYLLVTYQTGFGGDKWRHLGAEQWLMDGHIYTPALFGEQISYKQLGPIKIPEVFIAGNKTSYANMWGMTIALSWLTKIDIFYIDLFLGLLLFSIFLPFLLLKIGSLFSKKKEFLYLLALLPFLFFPFQIYGSITVPQAFGFLPFLFSLIFILEYFMDKFSFRQLLKRLVFLIPFLYFNYVLYLIVFLEIFILVFLLKNFYEFKRNKTVWLALIFICFLALVFLIPLLDTNNQYSSFKKNLAPTDFKSTLINFPIRILTSDAIFPRLYRMEQDNWLYSQTGEYLSRATLLKALPWHLILTPIILFLIILGIINYRKLFQPKIGYLFILILIIFLLNQFIGSYFMEGNHIFSKRLVIPISFLMMIPLAWGIYCLTEYSKHIFSRKVVIFALIMIIGLTSTTVYASGPKFQTVSSDELAAAKYVWEKINSSEPVNKHCVLANTWPLLALEAASGKKIVTGGFPYYVEYRQPERVQLFDNMNTVPSVRYIEKAMEVTGASQCYFMTEGRWMLFNRKDQIINQLDSILGNHQNIGQVMIWLYQPNIVNSY
ncbi:MAG: hypothetical protein WC499_01925 [Patescibacteria group bacterium]